MQDGSAPRHHRQEAREDPSSHAAAHGVHRHGTEAAPRLSSTAEFSEPDLQAAPLLHHQHRKGSLPKYATFSQYGTEAAPAEPPKDARLTVQRKPHTRQSMEEFRRRRHISMTSDLSKEVGLLLPPSHGGQQSADDDLVLRKSGKRTPTSASSTPPNSPTLHRKRRSGTSPHETSERSGGKKSAEKPDKTPLTVSCSLHKSKKRLRSHAKFDPLFSYELEDAIAVRPRLSLHTYRKPQHTDLVQRLPSSKVSPTFYQFVDSVLSPYHPFERKKCDIVLHNYQAYTTPTRLFEHLFEVYAHPFPLDSNSLDSSFRSAARSRVLWVFYVMAKEYLYMFSGERLPLFVGFLRTGLRKRHQRWREYLLAYLKLAITRAVMLSMTFGTKPRFCAADLRVIPAASRAQELLTAIQCSPYGKLKVSPGAVVTKFSGDQVMHVACEHGIAGEDFGTAFAQLLDSGRVVELKRMDDPALSLFALAHVPLCVTELPEVYDHYTVELRTIPALELARQLTLLSYRLFCDVRIEDVLKTVVSKDPSVRGRYKVFGMFERFQRWVLTEIARCEGAKKRAETIGKFIDVADFLLKFNSFEFFFVICTTLQLGLVNRVKARRIWEDVPKEKTRRFAEFERVVSFSGNYREFRAVFAGARWPKIPFSVLVMKDMAIVDENKDFVSLGFAASASSGSICSLTAPGGELPCTRAKAPKALGACGYIDPAATAEQLARVDLHRPLAPLAIRLPSKRLWRTATVGGAAGLPPADCGAVAAGAERLSDSCSDSQSSGKSGRTAGRPVLTLSELSSTRAKLQCDGDAQQAKPKRSSWLTMRTSSRATETPAESKKRRNSVFSISATAPFESRQAQHQEDMPSSPSSAQSVDVQRNAGTQASPLPLRQVESDSESDSSSVSSSDSDEDDGSGRLARDDEAPVCASRQGAAGMKTSSGAGSVASAASGSSVPAREEGDVDGAEADAASPRALCAAAAADVAMLSQSGSLGGLVSDAIGSSALAKAAAHSEAQQPAERSAAPRPAEASECAKPHAAGKQGSTPPQQKKGASAAHDSTVVARPLHGEREVKGMNMRKALVMLDILSPIRECQNHPYPFLPVDKIQDFLTNGLPIEEMPEVLTFSHPHFMLFFSFFLFFLFFLLPPLTSTHNHFRTQKAICSLHRVSSFYSFISCVFVFPTLCTQLM